MKNLMNKIATKSLIAEIRVKEALQNNEGMEVIQFLAVALVSITVAGLMASFASGSLQTAITNIGNKISTLFPAGT